MLSDEAKAHILGVLLEMELEGRLIELYIPPELVDAAPDMGMRNLKHVPRGALEQLRNARNRYDLRGDALTEAVLSTHKWSYLRNYAPVQRFVAELELQRRK